MSGLRPLRFVATWLLLGTLCLALPWSSQAAASDFRLTVHVIHASKKAGPVDPRLKQLEGQLRAFAFVSYRLHSAQQLTLKAGQKGVVSLPESRSLELTPLGREAAGKLKVRLSIAKVVDATYLVSDGGTLIVGGPKHEDGVLILAITQSATP